ncbi:hypothetical protein B0H17DRAFT_199442 [Mycena rosella]|uniref:GATA-type domain-containing protein n=1 Tax=Mycena rosella TaxID=1033263 RepID=A0AAD7GQD4_MYCRO|nr:hypothetical protein B0H17DRAFT_199442 [Mycena rosella]
MTSESTASYTDDADVDLSAQVSRRCFTCGATDSVRDWRGAPIWRRSKLSPGKILCKKCGTFEDKHKRARPLGTRGGGSRRPLKHLSLEPSPMQEGDAEPSSQPSQQYSPDPATQMEPSALHNGDMQNLEASPESPLPTLHSGDGAQGPSSQLFSLPPLYQDLMKGSGDATAQLNAAAGTSAPSIEGNGTDGVVHIDSGLSRNHNHIDATQRRCSNCGDDSKAWHHSTLFPGTILCGKCGQFERKHQRARPLDVRRGRPANGAQRRCSNCGDDSKLWHRSKLRPGAFLCTKCNSFERTHQRARPLDTHRGRPTKQPREQAPPTGDAPASTDHDADADAEAAPRRCSNCGDDSKTWHRSTLRPGALVRATLSSIIYAS